MKISLKYLVFVSALLIVQKVITCTIPNELGTFSNVKWNEN